MSKVKRLKAKQAHQRKILKKQQELEARALELEENPDLDEEEEELIEEEETSEIEAAEPVKKDYMEAGMSMHMGPTSFDELDAMRMAQEQAEKVDEVTWDVRSLVSNILWGMDDPKTKSQKMQAVAAEFEGRVTDAMNEDLQKDLDVLQVEAILAMDARHTGIMEKVGDLVKETLSAGARKKLSSEDFALPSKRKYPIHDRAHVRAALQRAAQMMKRGGQMAEDAKAAMPKIRAAAKKFGIEMGMEKSAIVIEKDAKGDWRWIGSPTNNFIDWQEDILAKSAHEKYVDWLDKNPECAPAFLSWHTPGTAREHPVDFWMEQNGAVIMSGILTEAEAAALFTVQKETDLGMSHQAFAMRLDPDPRVVTDYWIYEVSDLPLDKAANPFTTLETMTKEVGMDKLDYLTKIMGSKEKATAFLEKTGQMQKQLQEAGITSKENSEQPSEKKPEAELEKKPPEVMDVNQIVKQIVDQVGKEFEIDGLNAFVAQAQEAIQKVEVLEGLVKELSASNDDQLAKALTPPVSRYAWSQGARASQSDTTKLQKENAEDKKLSEAAPGVPDDYWLSKATGTAPITIETS